ncbi:hypothetical protein ROL70_08500 [Cronobacter sakazakii]|uniref:hypothetical protein n=1 Tax=Cronobacter sakazakii TaxID=28141 RepID=UPI0028939C2C|nr:hypothetical protein [Cronobacter sakazakii]MDT3585027.1 hypothetical protein [Cronobacter sakazakii]
MAPKNSYLCVDDIVSRVDQREVTRKTLLETRARFKAAGNRQAEVDAITQALEITKDKYSAVTRQVKRLSENADQMDIEKAILMKSAVCQFAKDSVNLQASIVVAYQNYFSVRGIPMSFEEANAFIFLSAADAFERKTGELPVLVD